MAERTKTPGLGDAVRIRDLDLAADMRRDVLRVCSDQVAVNVYRELQRLGAAVAAEGGCNIAGNCSSCSK